MKVVIYGQDLAGDVGGRGEGGGWRWRGWRWRWELGEERRGEGRVKFIVEGFRLRTIY